LIAVREVDLIAWATDTADEQLTRQDLLAHQAIVERIFGATNACLPARFGTPVTPELLKARHAELVKALDRVAGGVELAVTALWTHEAPPPRTGTAYLRARAQEIETAERLAKQVETACGEHIVQVEHHILPSREIALRSALLVSRDRVMTVTQRLPREMRGVRILVNGPWPPYTFAAVGGPREA
jgi:Gas vesicle synthesis protein GvpL/GvpF